MTGKSLTIGIVGAGRMGTRWAKIISEHPGLKLSVIVDVDEKVGRTLADTYSARYEKSVEKALSIDSPESFLVATPHRYLSVNAKKILTAKKHVFIEKPGAHSAKELKSIMALAKKHKKVCMVGFNYRFFDGVHRAYDLVNEGKIGDLLSLRIKHGHAGRVGYDREWRMSKAIAGGGVLMDQGVHLIDLALWFMKGKITTVHGIVSNAFFTTEVEDNAHVILKNNKGTIASLSVGITEWQPVFLLEAIGSQGSCVVNGVGRKYGGQEVVTVTTRLPDGTNNVEVTECNCDPDFSLHCELEEYIRAIREKRSPVPDVGNAYDTLVLISKIYAKK